MTLPAGTRVGPYVILAPIGAGGMGEVYRARDARLDRDVAIKILPEAFAKDGERLARFEREAKTLASLSHPNIAQIYGVERNALVMELVEGDTLASRLERGAMELDEALPIARQIAGALEAAHERGIVHRDLKPANVMLTPQGDAKVLDFGLAKAGDAPGSSGDVMNSPTVTSPATAFGVILGTASYMSPEQAKGRPIDRRTDVWSYGVLLLEMLTGERAFPGASVTEVLAAVMRDAPPFDRLPPSTPTAIHRLLRRCLEKDRAKRLDSMAAVRLEIDEAMADERAPAAASVVPRRVRIAWLPWAVAAIAVIAAASIGYVNRPAATPAAVTRLGIDLGADGLIAGSFGPAFDISPDGRTIVAAIDGRDGRRLLYVRRLDQLKAEPLAGTEGAVDPFFSPDGQWIGFFAYSQMKKVAVTGGAPIDLATIQVARGGWWGEDGHIYFTASPATRGRVMRMPATGGEPVQVGDVLPGHVTQRWAQLLPGAKAIIYTSHTNVDLFDEATLAVQALDGSAPRELMKGGYYWRYVPSGHMLYVHNSTLFAAPFDLDRLVFTGAGVPVVDRLQVSPTSGGAQFVVGAGGALLYAHDERRSSGDRISYLDLTGRSEPLREPEDNFQSLQFSPDGAKLALELSDGRTQPEIWVHDVVRDTRARLTVNDVADLTPVWTRDGKRLVYGSAVNGPPNLFWQPADGSGPPERLLTSPAPQIPGNWHPDGRRLVFMQGSRGPQQQMDIHLLTLPERTVTPLVATAANEGHPSISPDGRWLAYTSNETGQIQVYVRPFPQGEGRWPISNSPAAWPIWSPTGNSLFFTAMEGQLMRVDYDVAGGVFRPGRPVPVPNGKVVIRGAGYSQAIHPDGKRFAAALQRRREGPGARDEMVFVLGFLQEIKARVK